MSEKGLADRGLVTFFNIDKAGFYKIRKEKEAEHIEGSYESILKSVYDWIESEEHFVNCIPWDIHVHKSRTPIYVRDKHYDSDTGDYFFVFWRKITDKSGKLGGIAEDASKAASTGDAFSVEASKRNGKTLIVGQPMYYWFIKEFNILATIKFSDSLIDTQNVCAFIKRAINNRVEHPNKSTSYNEIYDPRTNANRVTNKVTYQSTDEKHKSLFLGFAASEKRINIYDANLEKLARKITHVVVRDVISTKVVEDNRSGILRLFERVLEKKKNNIFKRQVEVETAISLTGEELKDLVELYSETHDPTIDTWANIGFIEDGEDAPKFFNSYLERTHLYLDPSKRHEGIHYNADYIYSTIKRERNSLLASFYEQQEVATVNEKG
ncbi:hypothetical protein [Alteromonas lipotrueae]|uniref:hypothetical protein n=1 Tax=Alteromonas lipotrueae TaxID=2803814 RepID=UPI001C45075C|nr:hypothetical protein [Alteromonas lipotrueae]